MFDYADFTDLAKTFIYSKTTLLRLKTLDVRPIAMLLESLAPARNRAPLEQILPQSAPGSAIVSLAWETTASALSGVGSWVRPGAALAWRRLWLRDYGGPTFGTPMLIR